MAIMNMGAGGGNGDDLRKFLDGTIEEVNEPLLSSIRSVSGLFSGCNNLRKINLPNLSKDISTAFYSSLSVLESVCLGTISLYNTYFQLCPMLKTLELPNCTSKGSMYIVYSCPSLSVISLPNMVSVTKINYYSPIEEFYFENATYISNDFNSGNASIPRIIYAPKVTKVNSGMFTNYRNLSSVYMPEVVTIGNNAFSGCSSLEEASFPNCTTFEWTTGSSTGVSGIFRGCSNLKTAYFPKLSKIDMWQYSAFQGCTNLETLYFPLISYIENSMFQYCQSIRSVTFSTTVTTICSSAFRGCSFLEPITFNKLSLIMDYAFAGASFTSAIFKGSNASNSYGTIRGSAFADISAEYLEFSGNLVSIYGSGIWGGNGFKLDVDTFVDRTVTSLQQSAFAYARKLTHCSFPKLTHIGAYAFYGHYIMGSQSSGVTTISIPLCQVVSSSAFMYNINLSTISIPKCTYIYSDAFRSCHSLMDIYLKSTTMVVLSGTGAFSSTPMDNSTYTGSFGTIHVSSTLVATYKTATNWTVYSSRIAK